MFCAALTPFEGDYSRAQTVDDDTGGCVQFEGVSPPVVSRDQQLQASRWTKRLQTVDASPEV